MSKKPDDPKTSDKGSSSFIPQRKALAMGKSPNTGCGTGPKTKQ